jgi:small subunit ribosomal protein S8
MVTDPISNFIIALKNAAHAKKASVRVPYSQVKESIANVLAREGYLASVEKKGKKTRNHLEVEVAFENGKARIEGVKRVSKPSQRVYYGVRDIKPIRHGYGRISLSTPQGVMTGDEARKARVGGEALFIIW